MFDAHSQPVVLMYHGIVSEWTAIPKKREIGADIYDMPTVKFVEQMEWLKANNFCVDIYKEGSMIPAEHQVILTFDDGEMNNYDQAFPVLKKCGFPAYFFVIAKRVGEPGYMGWDELRQMHEAGMVIGSHGFSHEILTNLLDSQVEEELKASKRYFEKNLGIAVDSFSVPRGFCNDKVIRMAYDVGYKHIFISDRPRALQSACMSRVAVRSGWPIKRFERAVTGNIPFFERVGGKCKSIIKRILGEKIYDWIRNTLLKI